jgi:hypothetical protein
MVRILLITVLVMIRGLSDAQQAIVRLVPVSGRMSDEYAPVVFGNGLLFCSNRPDNAAVAYSAGQKPVYRMFTVSRNSAGRWGMPRMLSDALVSGMNDGPASYCEKDSILYLSRNNAVSRGMRNVNDPSNRLGIFISVFRNGSWSVPVPFPHNDPRYTLTTPAVSADGNRIYFASDMPGGSGSMDLYYCDRKEGQWSSPVNLGPAVNTAGNDLFPFAAAHGRLYFASDGRQGLGGKDLYYTVQAEGQWISPVHLDSTINSTADDFGIFTDSTFRSGYFSSNRRNTDDIFEFTQAPPVFAMCDSILPNRYCFTFFDERQALADTSPAEYRWDFGDGLIRTGAEAGYCFPGPGSYTVKLRIVDPVTGTDVAPETTYDVALEPVQQGIIHSVDIAVAGHPVCLSGHLDNPGKSRVAEIYWNTGGGFTAGGPELRKVFPEKGTYTVEAGMLVADSGVSRLRQVCVKKTIRVLEREPERAATSATEVHSAYAGNESFPVTVSGGTGWNELRKEYTDDLLWYPVGKRIAFSHFEPAASQDVVAALANRLKSLPEWQADILVFTAGEDHGQAAASRYAAALAFALKNAGADPGSFRCGAYACRERTALFPDREGNVGDEVVVVFSKK